MAEAYAMVHLVEQGWARQQDVARVFCCSARTVRRDQQRFGDGGLAALGCGSGYPKGRLRLPAARTGLIDQLKAEGHSNREIARRELPYFFWSLRCKTRIVNTFRTKRGKSARSLWPPGTGCFSVSGMGAAFYAGGLRLG
jgi:transposase